MRRDISGWSVRLDDATIARHTRSGAWPNRTVAELAAELAEREPDRVTHVFAGRAFRVGELLADAEALAASLAERGLVPGDVVSFQLPNWPEAVVIDLAAAMLGLVVAPIVPIYRDAEAAFMLADCRAKVAFVPGDYRGYDYLGMMRRLAPRLPHLELIAPVRVTPAGGDSGESYEALVGARGRLRTHPRVDANAVKLVMYTSGTTSGRPKGVLHSHNGLTQAVRTAYRHWGQEPGDTMLMASPLTHITGFGSGLELPFLCGLRTVFMERWEPREGVALIEQERATISMGATPFLQELVAEAERTGRRLPSLRTYACGGAAVPPALIRKTWDVLANCRAFRAFGSSEAPLVTLGFVGEREGDLAADTDGAIVLYDVKVVDDDGRLLPAGDAGEICVRGPALFLGYTDPQATAESFDADGYFHTGDLGYCTPERALVITGRKKDLINRGGEKVSAKEVEDILHRHPAIAEAAVVAMPHARLGETVAACVLLQPGATLTFDQAVAHVAAAGVARQKLPERLFVMDAFPRTASGKVRKDLLRAEVRREVETKADAA
jgi:acyl-CoA synthetase (AMP-forming)/AMP-acid ligase II